MIIVEPRGGLCNRMRCIASAYELAGKKRKVVVLWQCCSELNARFESLFMPIKGIKVINYKKQDDIRRRILKEIARMELKESDIRRNRIGEVCKKDFFERLNFPVYITTCLSFCDIEESIRIFVPSKAISSHIIEIMKDFTNNMVGVHIRRTDQIKSIEYSKTEAFVKLMKREIELDSSVKFYLATDDMKEEECLRSEFPDYIISNEKRTLERNMSAGMKDAVVDLYCLSRCNKLIGSYWSSFTDIAAIWRGIDCVVAGREDEEF